MAGIPPHDWRIRMLRDVLQLNLGASVVLFGIFPAIIIGLGIAYAIKQWRDGRKDDE